MGLHTFSDTTCAKYISTNTPPGVGADLSRPYIIHNPTNTQQGLFSAQMYDSELSAGVGADSSRPYIMS